MVEGGTYSIQVVTGARLEEYVRAWIDYNNDGLFNSVNELVLDVDDTLFYHNGTITIPTGATTNTLIRMRIVSDAWWMPAPPSCGTVQRGQAEDYGITIIAKPVADFTIAITDTCADIITVTDISTNSNSITWDFNDGNMDSTTTVVHTYTSSYTDSM